MCSVTKPTMPSRVGRLPSLPARNKDPIYPRGEGMVWEAWGGHGRVSMPQWELARLGTRLGFQGG